MNFFFKSNLNTESQFMCDTINSHVELNILAAQNLYYTYIHTYIEKGFVVARVVLNASILNMLFLATFEGKSLRTKKQQQKNSSFRPPSFFSSFFNSFGRSVGRSSMSCVSLIL